jgi:hypothetical protein
LGATIARDQSSLEPIDFEPWIRMVFAPDNKTFDKKAISFYKSAT